MAHICFGNLHGCHNLIFYYICDMLLKTEENKNKLELTYRPVNDPVEFQNELRKTDKIDIFITIGLYILVVFVILYNI